jgi:hypothetical protein
MNFSEWLEAEKGRGAEVAAHFNKTPSAVSQWKTKGVPLEHMKEVRDLTCGAVSLEEMVPSPAKRELASSNFIEQDRHAA